MGLRPWDLKPWSSIGAGLQHMVDLLQGQACGTCELVDRCAVVRQQLQRAAEQRRGPWWAQGSGLRVALLSQLNVRAAVPDDALRGARAGDFGRAAIRI